MPKTLESKRIFSPDQLMDEEALAQMGTSDEFAAFFTGDESPKVLVTATRQAGADTVAFAEELADLFPTGEYRARPPRMLIKDVVKGAVERHYTHLVVVNESRKIAGTPSSSRVISRVAAVSDPSSP